MRYIEICREREEIEIYREMWREEVRISEGESRLFSFLLFNDVLGRPTCRCL